MSSKNYKTVSIKTEEYEDYQKLAGELTTELGTTITVPEAIYITKDRFKKSRADATSGRQYYDTKFAKPVEITKK